ncbi:MAG: hypothetical protein JNL54_15735 [Kineosporiaceae bacterium]|nr:hypothetical protein [Kineosporiaceae bacterium]
MAVSLIAGQPAAAGAASSPRSIPHAAALPAGRATAALATRSPFPGKSATQIKRISTTAAAKARTVHVKGSVRDPELGPITVDIVIAANGARGTLTLTKSAASARLIRVGNTLFLQPDARFGGRDWAPDGELAGKWIRITRDDAEYWEMASLTVISGWARLIGDLRVTQRADGGVRGGTPTVRIHLPGSRGGSIYVASTGPAFPRLIVTHDKTVRFALYDWNAAVAPISRPAADLIIG